MPQVALIFLPIAIATGQRAMGRHCVSITGYRSVILAQAFTAISAPMLLAG